MDATVTRAEYDDVVASLKRRDEILTGVRRDLDVQFRRIAQMQVELDDVRRQLARRKG
jgi:hypothetical protein